jgi:hypothetical protein
VVFLVIRQFDYKELSMYREKTICEMVREMEENDKNGETKLSEFVSQNMRKDINKTEAYYHGIPISGAKDANGKLKPVVNICYPAVNIWYRATDRDSKDLKIRAKNDKQVIPAFLATILLQQWMNSENFGQFLNDWGHVLAKHGSAVIEIVESKGELNCRVLNWNDILVDAIDFDGNIKVKKLWFTPAQLKKNKSYDKEMVKSLLDNLEARETIEGDKKDNKANYILVYEVHGELPLSLLTDKESDDETYVEQMHVISFQASKDKRDAFNDYTLFKGREKKSPLMITHLIKNEGQTYVGGAVKNLFGAQWQINDDEKMIKDQLEIASKILFQGSDETMDGKSFFTNVDNGQYLHHKPGEPMTRVSTTPDITAIQNHQSNTKQHANTINGIADAMISQAKSGTAWRQTQAELQEAHSLFELMGETKDLYLKQIFKDYIIDFFKKQLDNNEAIYKYLDASELKEIDSRYLPAETNRRVNKKKVDTILSGEIYDPAMEQADMAEMGQQIESELIGNQRFIQPSKESWKEELKDLDWDLELDIPEAVDTQEQLATLNTALTFLVGLQGRSMTPDEQMVFNELMKASGTLSPLKLSFNQSKQQTAQPQLNQPQPAMAGGQ